MTTFAWVCLGLCLTATAAAADPVISPQPVPKLPGARIAAGPLPGTQAAQDAVHRLQGLADIVVNDQADCPKMALDIQAFGTQDGPSLRADQAVLDALSPAEKLMIKDSVKPQMTHIAQQMSSGMHACGQDKGVQAAMVALGNLPQ